jgi:hypothetical protein
MCEACVLGKGFVIGCDICEGAYWTLEVESSDTIDETTTTTKATLLTLNGTQYLLSLASKVVHSLHSHYEQQCQMAVTAGDEDSEAEIVENLCDVELTLKELDPVCWKGLVDKRLESTGEVVKSCYV